MADNSGVLGDLSQALKDSRVDAAKAPVAKAATKAPVAPAAKEPAAPTK